MLLAPDDVQRRALADAAHKAIDALIEDSVAGEETALSPDQVADFASVAVTSARLEAVEDADLRELNLLLPWAAMTMDPRGRVIGAAWDHRKRNRPHRMPDKRAVRFNARLPLAGKTVVELGCFEGIYTIDLCRLGAKVIGVDARIENVVKTLVRLWLYDCTADVQLWNLEETPPPGLPAPCDVLHHIGVLYHLSDPVKHLSLVLPTVREGVLLDTHVSTAATATHGYDADGGSWRYQRYGEKLTDISPFAGMRAHAKWLMEEDLVAILRRYGFSDVEVVERRAERNGPRLMIWAFR